MKLITQFQEEMEYNGEDVVLCPIRIKNNLGWGIYIGTKLIGQFLSLINAQNEVDAIAMEYTSPHIVWDDDRYDESENINDFDEDEENDFD